MITLSWSHERYKIASTNAKQDEKPSRCGDWLKSSPSPKTQWLSKTKFIQKSWVDPIAFLYSKTNAPVNFKIHMADLRNICYYLIDIKINN